MKVKGPVEIRIFCSKPQECGLWYSKLFDLSPTESTDELVSFDIHGVAFAMTLPDEKNPTSTGGTVAYWQVDDLESLL